MTIDEAIRQAEEVAEGYEEDISKWEYTLSEYRKRECVEQTTIPRCEKALNKCKQCASEHRQLSEWLRDYKRLLEQEPSVSEKPNNCEMRDATLEERESIDKYIKSISKSTGVKFGALEQEPCEDVISRAKAMTEIMMNTNIREHLDGNLYIKVADAVQILRDLSSVKPQEPTGHWIVNEWDNISCSECGCTALYDKIYPGESVFGKAIRVKSTFCPTCGARMEVEQNG